MGRHDKRDRKLKPGLTASDDIPGRGFLVVAAAGTDMSLRDLGPGSCHVHELNCGNSIPSSVINNIDFASNVLSAVGHWADTRAAREDINLGFPLGKKTSDCQSRSGKSAGASCGMEYHHQDCTGSSRTLVPRRLEIYTAKPLSHIQDLLPTLSLSPEHQPTTLD
ncbi:hypothetical protein Bbelb_330970 [Branchiostoma belcheri]|nr:hypothetical protein Bbelb_330970 [Branchiostoma belcheri]